LRILFDQGVPTPLRQHLLHHEVATAYERGWSKLKNGELLGAAETNGFTVLLTTDTNLRYQQNLKLRRIAVVILTTTSWPRIQNAVAEVVRLVSAAAEGQYTEVHIP
jgi:hypothetical protein